MKFYNRRSKSAIGVLFGLSTLLINWLAHYFPEFVECWYSRGLFQGIRFGFDWTLGQLPFPSFYLFWIGIVAFWIWLYRHRPKLDGLLQKLAFWFARIFGFAGILIGLFFWLWAFNYARIPLETQLSLDVQLLDSTALWQELEYETQELDSLRTSLVGNDTNALEGKHFWPDQAENTIRLAVEKWLASENFPVVGHVRSRFIYPEGTLFKFGASGIYWPFIGEGNLEAGMHPLRKLPSMAHEMSHGYGFCDEGVCNFIAYVACAEHSNPYIAYCAHLDYWSSVARACLEHDPNRYEGQFRPGIPQGIVADIRAIRKQNSKFQELAPAIRYEVYDSYLKAQGIESGMLNYEEVLMLVRAWRQKRLD
ncbi:MAG: DUF3810 family protein [Saprospiraceae bacterium]|nr:DUF3810 family protein [Saprospiraceae bacterium]